MTPEVPRIGVLAVFASRLLFLTDPQLPDGGRAGRNFLLVDADACYGLTVRGQMETTPLDGFEDDRADVII